MNYRQVLTIIFFFTACSFFMNPLSGADFLGKEKIPVGTGLLPLKTFVEKIGGDKITVTNLLPKGASPHSYSPTPLSLAKIMKSKVYFSSGLSFEERIIEKIRSSTDSIEFIDITTRVPLLTNVDCGCSSTHGKFTDVHLWMNPLNVVTMCTDIEKTLSRVDPDNKTYYRRNCIEFIKELNEVDRHLAQILFEFKSRDFYVYHPSLGYFANRYNLNQVPIENSGREPSGRQLAQLIRKAARSQVSTVFIQRDFPQNAAKKLAQAISGTVTPVDPLAENYCENILEIGNMIRASMKPSQ